MSPSDTEQPAEGSPTAAPSRNTHFIFESRVFQAPGANFRLVEQMGGPKEPMYGVAMAEGEAMLTLRQLRANFNIQAGSHDDQLIERAEQGLKYVPDIRPGDAIPNEILDGSASWTVSRKHKRIARERIQIQLINWMGGKPMEFAGPDELKAFLEVPSVRKQLREAFQKAAVQLGLKANDSEAVIERIESLARELCYIEALRERCDQVKRIREMLEVFTKQYYNDPRAVDEIGRCKKLIIDGVRELFTPLALLDVKITDVMNALQTVDELIGTVREPRDTVHFVLMQWDPVIALWQPLEPVRSKVADKAINALYKLLASRFRTGKSLMNKRK